MKKSKSPQKEEKKTKKSKTSLQKPWKAVSMTRIPRMGSADAGIADAVSGYLVDEEGNPIQEPKPWSPVYLRGLSKKSHPKWNVATGEAVVVIYRSDGWDIILRSGDRFVLREIDRGIA